MKDDRRRIDVFGLEFTVILGRPNDENLIGKTDYVSQTIWVDRRLSIEQRKRTLVHELTHAYLWSTGAYQGNGDLTDEQVCDFIAIWGGRIIDTATELTAFITKGGNGNGKQ